MSDVSSEGIKTGSFDTWAKTAPIPATDVKAVQVKVDNRAATRQAIIVELRRKGITFKTRSDWRARDAAKTTQSDWDYKAIALHHAGNSYSCSADGSDQLRKLKQRISTPSGTSFITMPSTARALFMRRWISVTKKLTSREATAA